MADRLDVLTYNALCIYLRRLRVSCSLAMASALARLCSANGFCPFGGIVATRCSAYIVTALIHCVRLY